MSDTEKWAYTNVYPAAMVEDKPMLASTIEHEQLAAKDLAVTQGYTLLGEPTITSEPTVLLDNFSEQGPAMVGLEFARQYADYKGEATSHSYRYEWDATRD